MRKMWRAAPQGGRPEGALRMATTGQGPFA
jgi:hypothetical protein